MHKAHESDYPADLLDADALAGEDGDAGDIVRKSEIYGIAECRDLVGERGRHCDR
jgi:hypothetical protein